MYLTDLTVKNVKLLADQTISFKGRDGKPRKWTVLLGDNGLCKTTILQLIALASSGEKLSRALVGEAQAFVNARTPKRGCSFEARFSNGRARAPVKLAVRPPRRDFTGNKEARKLDLHRAIPRDRESFFIVGYGVGRYLPRRGEVAVPTDLVVDRVEGLFDTRHKMLGVDFFDALNAQEREKHGRVEGAARNLGLAFATRLRQVLLTEDSLGEKLLPALATVELRGKDGVSTMKRLLESRRFELKMGEETYRLAPDQLSQGYQSMIAWICDLLGHAFLEFGDVDPANLTGIALLDEIDLHLHPTWQRRMIPLLRSAFPKMQFIVTTHSPLVLTGFEQEEVLSLRLEGGEVRARPVEQPPGALSSSALLASFFDVPKAGRPELVAKEREYLALLGISKRKPAHEKRLKELERALDPYWTRSSGA